MSLVQGQTVKRMALALSLISSFKKLKDFTEENDALKLRSKILTQAAKCVYSIVLTYETAKGITYEEEFEGHGRSLEEAKENTASKALNTSSTLQTVKHGSSRQYQRCGSQTGYVLIICFLTAREGAEKDVERILRFMQDHLKYKCRVCYDPTYRDLQRILEETAQHLGDNTRDYFSFTLFIMGHGNKEGVKTKDHVIKVRDTIDKFHNKNLPQFAGKPKAFFIQCCRGRAKQQMVYQADSYDGDDDQLIVDLCGPEYGDIYVAYATTEGHVAFRNPDWGTIFIFHCIETFRSNYSKAHLEEMMIDVKGSVSDHPDLYAKKGQTKVKLSQMPITTSTLRKRLFF